MVGNVYEWRQVVEDERTRRDAAAELFARAEHARLRLRGKIRFWMTVSGALFVACAVILVLS